MLRKNLSKFGTAAAVVAVGAIMAISPAFAQGTAPSSPGTGSTLLQDILKAAIAAGLTAEQTNELLEVADELTTQAPAPEVDTEDVDEDMDETEVDEDTGEAEAATTEKETEKHKITVQISAPKSGEEKGDD